MIRELNEVGAGALDPALDLPTLIETVLLVGGLARAVLTPVTGGSADGVAQCQWTVPRVQTIHTVVHYARSSV